MRSPLIKGLALMLAALMLLPMTACGTGESTSDTTAPVTQGQTESDTQNMDYVCELPDELDYQGAEVNILYVKKSGREDELISEELGHGIISDAVYERKTSHKYTAYR